MSTTSSTHSSNDEAAQQGPFFILHYNTRRVLVGPPIDYAQLQLAIRRHFPDIPADHRVSYHTDELAISKGVSVEISEEIWAAAIPLLKALTVQAESQATPAVAGAVSVVQPANDGTLNANTTQSSTHRGVAPLAPHPPLLYSAIQAGNKLTLNITSHSGRKLEVQYDSSTSIEAVLSQSEARSKLGYSPDERLKASYKGSAICSSNSLNEWKDLSSVYGPYARADRIEDGATIDISPLSSGYADGTLSYWGSRQSGYNFGG